MSPTSLNSVTGSLCTHLADNGDEGMLPACGWLVRNYCFNRAGRNSCLSMNCSFHSFFELMHADAAESLRDQLLQLRSKEWRA